ncbi:hypothetical protein SAMN05216327_10422 [Dyadobacter sp. SG02]|uniref:hypothetical protein n=1 Tax=Dyadobacter sp. SG02 TaxID=1855291 RepID=UPI0008D5ED06|nr:hypothetical protein [Dyadobacter sp. SG02]SEI80398.1 hypothetical protein SAMN05216327_10422 [Dyadobacter sp. SG02]
MNTLPDSPIKQMLDEYITSIGRVGSTKIALNLHNSGIFVWAEIPDGRKDIEDKLIMAEARVNSVYHRLGINMNTIYFEESDKLAIPIQYQLFSNLKPGPI